MCPEIFRQFTRKKLSPHPPPPPPGRDHVLEGRRSQEGLTPNSLHLIVLDIGFFLTVFPKCIRFSKNEYLQLYSFEKTNNPKRIHF